MIQDAAAIRPSDWEFRFRSGRLCLDFISTVGDRDHIGFDRWRDEGDFARWCVASGLFTREIPVTPDELDAARRLREALYRLVTQALAGASANPDDLGLLNAEAGGPPLVPQLTAFGRPRAWSSASPQEALRATVARDAIDLLSGDALKRVRKCADGHCSILFTDNSRPGKRRWCAMNGCGNKVKKAAYRRRQKGG